MLNLRGPIFTGKNVHFSIELSYLNWTTYTHTLNIWVDSLIPELSNEQNLSHGKFWYFNIPKSQQKSWNIKNILLIWKCQSISFWVSSKLNYICLRCSCASWLLFRQLMPSFSPMAQLPGWKTSPMMHPQSEGRPHCIIGDIIRPGSPANGRECGHEAPKILLQIR